MCLLTFPLNQCLYNLDGISKTYGLPPFSISKFDDAAAVDKEALEPIREHLDLLSNVDNCVALRCGVAACAMVVSTVHTGTWCGCYAVYLSV